VFEIGSSLRSAREHQQLEFSDVERATRIRSRYLQALEEDRFDVLPGTAYVKGFLRSYADHLGLDGQRFVDEYNARFPPEEEPQAVPPVRVRHHRRLLDARLVAIPVVAALAVFLWHLTTGGSQHHTAFAPTLPHVRVSTTVASPATTTQAPAVAPARLAVVAARGTCWLSVRLNSQFGKVLYERTLEAGQTVRFSGRRLWLRLGAPWNVDATLNGKRAQLPTATGDAVVTPTGLKPVSTG
jgi:Helix-turn-helix domain/RodZ C-terminal domain